MTNYRSSARAWLWLVAAAMLAPAAWAFYPSGFFNDITGGNLIFIKWPLNVLDTNHDGDVTPGEGIELNFETGTDSVNQFTTEEVDQVLAGFQEWQHVSTAYIAFHRGQDVTEPVELTNSFDQIDGLNVVVFESTQDVADNGGTSLTGGALGLTLSTAVFTDGNYTINGVTVPLTGGQFIDVDNVISQAARDIANTPLGPIMKGIAVIGAGVTIGLDYSPLNNFDATLSEQEGTNIEDRVVALRNFDGSIGLRGVTSSMYNDFAYYKEDNASLTDSHQDLAPDDIAGITFMYPRTDVDLFFNISQRARTQSTKTVPSVPLAGAWIRAWCDADNNPGTARVPLVDTFTGLYENVINTDFRGNFQLKGLFQQLETIGEVTFTANYTLTCSEFLPDIFGKEPTDERGVYDSTHGGFNLGTPNGFGFDTLFPAEVFREGTSGNIFGLQNRNQGTPLYFDPLTRKVTSLTSGITLDTILGGGRPMFGDQSQVCPLNVVVAGINVVEGPKLLRTLRDKLMLTSAIGVSIADTYYRVAPSLAQFLLHHDRVLAATRWMAKGFEWLILHAEILLVIVLAAFALSVARRIRRRHALTAMLIGIACALAAPRASAQIIPFKDMADFVAASSDIVQGSVTSTDTHMSDDGKQIYTDILINVTDTAKGNENKGSLLHLRLPTGRVGGMVRWSPQLPSFTQGEEVLLFLQQNKQWDHVVTGAAAGKFKVTTDAKTGEKAVVPTTVPGSRCLKAELKKNQPAAKTAAAKDAGSDNATTSTTTANPPEPVKLTDFMNHLRSVDQEQKRQAR